MNQIQIRKICRSLAGTTEKIQWGNDLVFKVAGKMYVCFGLESECFSFKCAEQTFFELSEMPGIKPAPYLARAHWIQIDPKTCPLNAKQIEKLIRQSYELVFSKLPQKTQTAIMK